MRVDRCPACGLAHNGSCVDDNDPITLVDVSDPVEPTWDDAVDMVLRAVFTTVYVFGHWIQRAVDRRP